MNERCPSCGALLIENSGCADIFNEFLVLEFTDSAYGAVHFLTVACFMIQHGLYSDPSVVWIERQLRSYLEHGKSPGQIREQASIDASQSARRWKVTRQPHDSPQEIIPWSMTILDVYSNYRDALSYCALVTKWAQITLDEMQPLLKSSSDQ